MRLSRSECGPERLLTWGDLRGCGKVKGLEKAELRGIHGQTATPVRPVVLRGAPGRNGAGDRLPGAASRRDEGTTHAARCEIRQGENQRGHQGTAGGGSDARSAAGLPEPDGPGSGVATARPAGGWSTAVNRS